MSRHLLTVSDTFAIRGRGLVIAPGIMSVDGERFRVGDGLLLKRPDGSELRTTIGGIELLDSNPTNQTVILLKELKKADVPIGTEVWRDG